MTNTWIVFNFFCSCYCYDTVGQQGKELEYLKSLLNHRFWTLPVSDCCKPKTFDSSPICPQFLAFCIGKKSEVSLQSEWKAKEKGIWIATQFQSMKYHGEFGNFFSWKKLREDSRPKLPNNQGLHVSFLFLWNIGNYFPAQSYRHLEIPSVSLMNNSFLCPYTDATITKNLNSLWTQSRSLIWWIFQLSTSTVIKLQSNHSGSGRGHSNKKCSAWWSNWSDHKDLQ